MGLLSAAAPDSFIFAFLLKAAANYWSLMTGRQLHCQALLHGLDGHLFVGTWDDFDKGDGDGEEGVSGMEVKDDVPWISMITALTQNRCFDEVFGVFMDLRQLGMRANEVSLTGVFSSCAQAGAFEFGRIVHGFVEKSGFSWIISWNPAIEVDSFPKCRRICTQMTLLENERRRMAVAARLRAGRFYGLPTDKTAKCITYL
ncbi:hypothetical protein Q3G72_032365 [Acer saccharum]|nr:hypothetical protein Q3G72_032365 [Acer saccharum]